MKITRSALLLIAGLVLAGTYAVVTPSVSADNHDDAVCGSVYDQCVDGFCVTKRESFDTRSEAEKAGAFALIKGHCELIDVDARKEFKKNIGVETKIKSTVKPTTATPTAACSENYAPVCGKVEVTCVQAPCHPVYETFSNACHAKQANALSITKGACEEKVKGEIRNFYDCQAAGNLVLSSFPRRCLASDGQVFQEKTDDYTRDSSYYEERIDERDDQEAIAAVLGRMNGKAVNAIVDYLDGQYARGSYNIKGRPAEGGKYLAVREGRVWVIKYHGDRSMNVPCVIMEEYKFPEYMRGECNENYVEEMEEEAELPAGEEGSVEEETTEEDSLNVERIDSAVEEFIEEGEVKGASTEDEEFIDDPLQAEEREISGASN